MGVSRVASKAQTLLQKIPNDIIARSVGQSIFLATEGVFTALSNMDWYQLVVPEAGVYTGPGVSSAIAANRISRSAEKCEPPSFLIPPHCSEKAILSVEIQEMFCFGWFISN